MTQGMGSNLWFITVTVQSCELNKSALLRAQKGPGHSKVTPTEEFLVTW
jgi:hypothetical protein